MQFKGIEPMSLKTSELAGSPTLCINSSLTGGQPVKLSDLVILSELQELYWDFIYCLFKATTLVPH